MPDSSEKVKAACCLGLPSWKQCDEQTEKYSSDADRASAVRSQRGVPLRGEVRRDGVDDRRVRHAAQAARRHRCAERRRPRGARPTRRSVAAETGQVSNWPSGPLYFLLRCVLAEQEPCSFGVVTATNGDFSIKNEVVTD